MSAGSTSKPRLAFFMATLGSGGIGKMRVHLTEALVDRGVPVDLVLGDVSGPYLDAVDPRVRVIELGSAHAWFAVPRLANYLRREAPFAVFVEKLRVNLALIRARNVARSSTRSIASIHGHLTHKLYEEGLSPRKRDAKLRHLRACYRRNHAFVCVSRGIAADLLANFHVPDTKVHVVNNPVITDTFFDQVAEEPGHPWARDLEPPLIVTAGRLVPQKDLGTLLEAFAILRRKGPARLLVLGEGDERSRLATRAREVGVEDDVAFAGHVPNPYAIIARGKLFVLSSRWEGFGNVLVEALAAGVPVVATDCPVGPREILQDSRLGPLVTPGDAPALARAMAATLDAPPDAEMLRREGAAYTARRAAEGYLRAAGYPMEVLE